MDILLTPAFWAALGSIILANVLLSGDNAVVIAMAARGLPASQQKKAIVFGSGAAIVMRIVLTLIAVRMLGLPYLKLVGGLALLYIGANLMSEEEEQHERRYSADLWTPEIAEQRIHKVSRMTTKYTPRASAHKYLCSTYHFFHRGSGAGGSMRSKVSCLDMQAASNIHVSSCEGDTLTKRPLFKHSLPAG